MASCLDIMQGQPNSEHEWARLSVMHLNHWESRNKCLSQKTMQSRQDGTELGASTTNEKTWEGEHIISICQLIWCTTFWWVVSARKQTWYVTFLVCCFVADVSWGKKKEFNFSSVISYKETRSLSGKQDKNYSGFHYFRSLCWQIYCLLITTSLALWGCNKRFDWIKDHS